MGFPVSQAIAVVKSENMRFIKGKPWIKNAANKLPAALPFRRSIGAAAQPKTASMPKQGK